MFLRFRGITYDAIAAICRPRGNWRGTETNGFEQS